MRRATTLLRNRGTALLKIPPERRANPLMVLGASFADFDNDGWLDIYAPMAGFHDKGTEIELTSSQRGGDQQQKSIRRHLFRSEIFGRHLARLERNRHLRNNGDGTFTELGARRDRLEINSRV